MHTAEGADVFTAGTGGIIVLVSERAATVVMRCPETSEVGAVDRLPSPGQRIRATDNKIWFVTDVLQSGVFTYMVECVGRPEFYEQLRLRSAHEKPSGLLMAASRPVITLRANESGDAASPRSFRNPFQDWIEIYLAKSVAGATDLPSEQHGHGAHDERAWIDKYLD